MCNLWHSLLENQSNVNASVGCAFYGSVGCGQINKYVFMSLNHMHDCICSGEETFLYLLRNESRICRRDHEIKDDSKSLDESAKSVCL